MTHAFTDAQLRDFLDGRLSDALAAEIESAINADPALAAQVEALAPVDLADSDVRSAFAPVLEAPVPERFERIVMPPSASVTDLTAVRADRAATDANTRSVRDWRWPQFTAMAASLAIGVMIGGPLIETMGAGANGDALVLAGAQGPATPTKIAAMLETVPSGTKTDLDQLGQGEVLLTFKNTDGQLCRQFSVNNQASTSDAVACKGANGWQIEALGRRAAPQGEMRLASGDASAAVLAAVDEMIDGDPLVGDDEHAELQHN